MVNQPCSEAPRRLLSDALNLTAISRNPLFPCDAFGDEGVCVARGRPHQEPGVARHRHLFSLGPRGRVPGEGRVRGGQGRALVHLACVIDRGPCEIGLPF